jgi:acetyl-CoA synthetase
MALKDTAEEPLDRVLALIADYSSPAASAAYLLCDRHDPSTVAYQLIGPDLSSTDLTYGQLRDESERFAGALYRLGLRQGDRIATLMGKTRAYLVTLMAIWRMGAVHVPLFTAFAPASILFRLSASSCKLVVCDPTQRSKLLPSEIIPSDPPWQLITTGPPDAVALGYDDLIEEGDPYSPAEARGGDWPIIQIYTSGTTGEPKGVLVPLRAVAGFQVYAEFSLGVVPGDVFWNAADPGWAYGLYFGILATFATDVKGVLLEGGFSPETTLCVLSKFGVTNFTAAPTVYRALRRSGLPRPADLTLRCASSAGEPLTPEVNEWAARSLGVAVHDHYGQTETGMLINNHHHPALRRALKPGSMGQVMPGWTAVILYPQLDEIGPAGELGRVAMDLRESPLAWFDGYVGDAAKSAAKFTDNKRWYLTDDIAVVDGDGYFHFSAREDDVIIMAGYRIGPFEVESVLITHPSVAECAVIAGPDDVRGEVVEAVVVLREGCTACAELTADLQEWIKGRYAAHAYPRRVHYVDLLPKTPSGKIQRSVLRAQFRNTAGKA